MNARVAIRPPVTSKRVPERRHRCLEFGRPLSAGGAPSGRSLGRSWRTAIVLAFLFSAAALKAQGPPPFPGWLVPVLQVVTEADVVPGTGVVLGPGRVLVPAEFAAVEVPLVVLDGGGDLARHGRPAAVLERWPLAGFTLLDVPGLERAPPVFASEALDDGQTVVLWAIAPPELLRQGEATVSRRAAVAVDDSGQVTLGDRQRLPNLSGALLNACGQWVGHSAARGVASLASEANTLYQWLPILADQLVRKGITLEQASCDRDFAPVAVVMPPDVTTENSPENTPERTVENDPSLPDNGSPGERDEASAESVEEAPPMVATGVTTGVTTGDETPDAPPPAILLDEPENLSAPGLPPVADPATEDHGSGVDPDGVGPLEGAGEDSASPTVPGSDGMPVWAWVLILTGTALTAVAAVWSTRRSAAAPAAIQETVAWLRHEKEAHVIVAVGGVVDCVLGRGDADLLVTSETISRHHARFRGAPGSLQLIDLESTNGSFVNDLPCTPRAGVAVAPGDRLRFGDREFVLEQPEAERL